MTSTAQIKEHMKVIGSDGQPVGTVDRIQGKTIILTKSNPLAGGQRIAIPLSMIANVEQDAVRLNLPATQAHQQWQLVGGASSGQSGGTGSSAGRM